MKHFAMFFGRIAYWLSWPALYMYLRGSVRTRVLIIAEEKVLLVQPWLGSGTWSLPGGGVRRSEDIRMAVTRELIEETGVALGVDQLQPLGLQAHSEKRFSYTCHYFFVDLKQAIRATPHLPEILDARWVSLQDLRSYQLDNSVELALSARKALLQ